MTWMNQNAAAIQAAAALASVLITAVLVVITSRYVRLTKEIADTARQEFQLLKSQRALDAEERRRRLFSLISNLQAITQSFPINRATAEKIRDVPLWAPSDPSELHRVAATFGVSHAELAGEATRHLATIADLVRSVQNTPVAQGFNWNRFPWDPWLKSIEGANRCLTSLETEIESTR